jgi:hypothetical protein
VCACVCVVCVSLCFARAVVLHCTNSDMYMGVMAHSEASLTIQDSRFYLFSPLSRALARSLARFLTLLHSRSFSTSLYLSISCILSLSHTHIHTPHTHIYIEKWVY